MLAAMAIAAFPAILHATTCSVPPPCGRVRPGSVLFVGLVVDADPPNDNKNVISRPARMQVKEPFQGIPAGTDEVLVFTQGSWLKRGATYLFDGGRRSDGILEPSLCGATEEIESSYARDIIEYLRNRKSGQVPTSLSVWVRDEMKSLPD